MHIVSQVNKGQSEFCDKSENGCLVVYGVLLEHELGIDTMNEVLEKFLSVLPLNRTGEQVCLIILIDFSFNMPVQSRNTPYCQCFV